VTKMVCRMPLSGHSALHRHAQRVRGVSSVPPIAPELVHRGQMTLSAKRGLMQCSRYCRFIRAMRRREARMFLGL
jgi:hypothetical protein